MDEQVAQN